MLALYTGFHVLWEANMVVAGRVREVVIEYRLYNT